MGKRMLRPGNAQGEPVEVELAHTGERDGSSLSIRVGDARHEVEVQWTGPGSGVLRMQGRVLPFHSVRTNGRIEAWVAGRTYKFEAVDGRSGRSTRSAGGRLEDLVAPMPGTVLKILAKQGSSFEVHQPLVVMESMKMEMTLSAPAAGVVDEVVCKEGQLVEMGAMLLKLSEAEQVHESAQ